MLETLRFSVYAWLQKPMQAIPESKITVRFWLVQTYVMEQDEMTIRDVIRRELDRDGQVFIIYNRRVRPKVGVKLC